MPLRSLFISLLVSISSCAMAQHRIYGYVFDQASGEMLVGASVFVPATGRGIVTNEQGYYSLSLPRDSVTVQVSTLGYESKRIPVLVDQDFHLDIGLVFNNVLQELTITAPVESDAISSTEMSVNKISGQAIQRSTMLLGEPDVLKSLQLLPGVKSGNEGFAGLYVRGGTPDQNLILMDGVPIYNVNHLFGFLSVFNTDVVKDVKLYKGAIPARFGDRLSSVVDIGLKEGNRNKSGGGFSISPLSGHFFLEGPVKKNKSSYIISLRKSWLDLLTQVWLVSSQKVTYNFYDFNFKLNHSFNARNNLTFSVYAGNDRFKQSYQEGSDKSSYTYFWNNATFSLRWNRIYGSHFFGTTSLYRSNYNFEQESMMEIGSNQQLRSVKSTLNDLSLQQDFEFDARNNVQVKFGAKISSLGFAPEVKQIVGMGEDTTLNATNEQRTPSAAAYSEFELKLSRRFLANVGARASVFIVSPKVYAIFQPRASMAFLQSKNSSIKLSYNRMGQFFHLLTNSSLSFPTDLWVPSTTEVRPEISDQVAAGYNRKIWDGKLEVSIEAYYKWMQNLVEYQDGSNYIYGSSQTWQDKVTVGSGQSRGVELFINKQKGMLTGWISYCLSYTDRVFTLINDGERFPFRYDRRHDISIFTDIKIQPRKSLSFVFVLNSGNWVTLPVATYQGVPPPNFGLTERALSGEFPRDFQRQELIVKRNNYRMPTYHRLDVNYQTWKMTKRNNKRTWIFSVYNTYAQMNPFLIYQSGGAIKKLVIFPIVPSICYKLEF